MENIAIELEKAGIRQFDIEITSRALCENWHKFLGNYPLDVREDSRHESKVCNILKNALLPHGENQLRVPLTGAGHLDLVLWEPMPNYRGLLCP